MITVASASRVIVLNHDSLLPQCKTLAQYYEEDKNFFGVNEYEAYLKRWDIFRGALCFPNSATGTRI